MAENRWNLNIKPYLKEIEKWARSGDSGKDIAEKLNIGYSTFRKYAASQPELADILRNSKNHVKRITEKALAMQEPNQRIKPEPLMAPTNTGGVKRPDQNGTHRKAFERAKKRIYATESVCGICGKPVDFNKKYPHPLSPCIDHIIPVAKGGHPSDISNLQLAHWTCNRQKSDKILSDQDVRQEKIISNRILPQSMDWKKYDSKK